MKQLDIWTDSKENIYTKKDQRDFYWYVEENGCEYEFDSLPSLVKIKSKNDSIKNYQQQMDKLRRKSFAHLAVSIANSDSIEFIHVKKECQWQTPENPIANYRVNCSIFPSKFGIFHNYTKLIKTQKNIRSIGKLFIEEIIRNDSIEIYNKRNNIPEFGLSCSPNLVAVLILYYDGLIYRIDFNDTYRIMSYDDNSNLVMEHYSVNFYRKMLKYFGINIDKSSSCRG